MVFPENEELFKKNKINPNSFMAHHQDHIDLVCNMKIKEAAIVFPDSQQSFLHVKQSQTTELST